MSKYVIKFGTLTENSIYVLGKQIVNNKLLPTTNLVCELLTKQLPI